MIFEQVKCGGDRNFAYIIGDEESKEAALVDPAYGVDELLARVNELGLEVKYIVNTHGHGDHRGGNADVQAATDAKVVAHTSAGYADEPVNDGDVLNLGALELKVIHTPGHTEDGICVLAEDKLCTGDTLFVGKVGGTGFGDDAQQEYDSLHNKLMTLDDGVSVWPGHDYGVAPSSTIANEKETNPFILRPDLEAFVDLKKNWLQYKAEHGIK
jgi:glyoxylase-like metal-dependent hydrolase (beta-lactamase superfamily II)